MMRNPSQAILAAIRGFNFKEDSAVWDPEAYRARPLNGLWATAPFLHNGSVLNSLTFV